VPLVAGVPKLDFLNDGPTITTANVWNAFETRNGDHAAGWPSRQRHLTGFQFTVWFNNDGRTGPDPISSGGSVQFLLTREDWTPGDTHQTLRLAHAGLYSGTTLDDCPMPMVSRNIIYPKPIDPTHILSATPAEEASYGAPLDGVGAVWVKTDLTPVFVWLDVLWQWE
jgi:hypothetical protein